MEHTVTEDTVARLESVGWDFAGARTNFGPHRIHPYPARFIPQIPRTLIELLHPQDDSRVLDPFCGSGTTLVEASAYGVPSVGIDLHPLAALIAKVKTTPLKNGLSQIAEGVVSCAKERTQCVVVPDIPRLDHWFQDNVQKALAALVQSIDELTDQDVRDALRVAFSSIVVRVSNQDSDTRYAAVDKGIETTDVWNQFSRAARVIADALDELQPSLFHAMPEVHIVNKDILKVEHDDVGDNIGLVVTSPPYPNAYEYWLYHKYRMYWLGMDPISVRESEIGARPHYFRKNHQTEVDFERQMGQCFQLLSRVMNTGCHACFVVGRSIIHGREIDNQKLLERAAEPHGFRRIAGIQRNIAASRKSFNPAHGTINREGIVVFRLEA